MNVVVLSVGIILAVVALVALLVQRFKMIKLKRSYNKGKMYADKYEKSHQALASVVPVWGTLLVVGVAILCYCFIGDSSILL